MGTFRRATQPKQAEHGSIEIGVSGGRGLTDRILGPLVDTGASGRGHQGDLVLHKLMRYLFKTIEDHLWDRIMEGLPRRIEDR